MLHSTRIFWIVLNLIYPKCLFQVLSEFGVHFFVCLLFLLCREFSILSMNFPLLIYHVYRYSNRPRGMSSCRLYDPTTILNARQIMLIRRESEIKFIFYLFMFIFYIFRVTDLLIVDSYVGKPEDQVHAILDGWWGAKTRLKLRSLFDKHWLAYDLTFGVIQCLVGISSVF